MPHQPTVPSAAQQRTIAKMLHEALVEIRLVARSGNATRAGELADVFHNLPTYLVGDEFDAERFGSQLLDYQIKHYQDSSRFDFLAAWDEATGKTAEVPGAGSLPSGS